jgi:ABC-type phosphate/phosphonate transport system substrate-binding protein
VPEGEDAAFYGADLVVAPAARETEPAQLLGARVAFNGDDSLSGWVMPRHALRELGIDPDGYVWVRTGSHHNSLRAVLRATRYRLTRRGERVVPPALLFVAFV